MTSHNFELFLTPSRRRLAFCLELFAGITKSLTPLTLLSIHHLWMTPNEKYSENVTPKLSILDTGGPHCMRSFYLRFCVYAIEKWPFFLEPVF